MIYKIRAVDLLGRTVVHEIDVGDRKVELFPADLRGADLRNKDLRRVDLQSANLEDALLIGADLREANLRGAQSSECRHAIHKSVGCRLTGNQVRRSEILSVPDAKTRGQTLRREDHANDRYRDASTGKGRFFSTPHSGDLR